MAPSIEGRVRPGFDKRLEYSWGKGLSVDSILAYHDSTEHADWVHAVSGARVLNAQHPEFELYSQGIHARRGQITLAGGDPGVVNR